MTDMNDNENRPRRLVRMKEACPYARIGKTKMYQLLKQGLVKGYKDGRTTWIDLDSIDEYRRSLPPLILGFATTLEFGPAY